MIWEFDVIILILLVVSALVALHVRDLIAASIIFGIYSFLMCLLWAEMGGAHSVACKAGGIRQADINQPDRFSGGAPPPGPAMPVIDRARSAPEAFRQPTAIARATASLTAPSDANIPSDTPSRSILA